MLALRVDYLLGFLGTDNTRLAAYAGCSESNFSRIRSGSRKLAPHSSTVRRFAGAVYACAEDKELTAPLCSLIGCVSGEKDDIVGRLVEWLFLDDDVSQLPKNIRSDPAAFGSKLDQVMTITEMSNSRLARQANVDASYISRMRSGQRIPKNNPELIGRLCTVLTVRAKELEKTGRLIDLIGVCHGSEDSEGLSRMLAAWLTDRSGSGDLSAVKRLISSISMAEHIPECMLLERDKAADPKILSEKREYYVGINGLRRGIVRLLGNASARGGEVLMFYSDLSQKWMRQEFSPIWFTLMHDCLKAGMKIWMIHHIDRVTDEIVDAIQRWMPLYMSGLIVPYYCTLPSGERFSTALFSDPGYACLAGQCVKGCENDAVFRFATDPEELAAVEHEMCALFSKCRPMLKHSRGLITPEEEHKDYEQNGIRLCIADKIVSVCKLTEPQMTFTIEHPKLVEAFKAYAEKL